MNSDDTFPKPVGVSDDSGISSDTNTGMTSNQEPNDDLNPILPESGLDASIPEAAESKKAEAMEESLPDQSSSSVTESESDEFLKNTGLTPNSNSDELPEDTSGPRIAEPNREDAPRSASVSQNPEPDRVLSPEPSPSAKSSSSSSPLNSLLLVAGPLFLLASIAITLVTTFKASDETQLSLKNGEQQWVTGISNNEYLRVAPENPQMAYGYGDINKTEALESGGSYSYDNPYFEWTPGLVSENGSQVIGYKVYFGPMDGSGPLETHPLYPEDSGISISGTSFSPRDYGVVLVPGTTYYLMVQTVSNGLVQSGYDRQTWSPASSLFTYTYQPL